ncbi:MAG: NDP-sugar synthase [Acidimicrobiia bacterium]
MTPKQAVLLVGGRGTRMWPLSAEVPKGLLPLAGVPFVDYQIARLAEVGVEEVFLAVDTEHLAAWQAYAAGVESVAVHLSVEEERLDTAGPVRAILDRLDGLFFVLNGDVVVETDLGRLVAAAPDTAVATLALVEVVDTSAYGVVVTDADGMVERFVEKPPAENAPAKTVNAGIYLMRPEALDIYEPGSLSFERVVFPDLVAAERLAGVVVDAAWIDIGTPSLYLDTHASVLLEAGRAHVAPPGVATGGSWAWVAPDATVAEGAVVAESVILGGATVDEGAVIRRAIIGWGAHIGSGVIVTGDSVVGPRAKIRPGCELDHGMRIGPEVVLTERAVTFTPPK